MTAMPAPTTADGLRELALMVSATANGAGLSPCRPERRRYVPTFVLEHQGFQFGRALIGRIQRWLPIILPCCPLTPRPASAAKPSTSNGSSPKAGCDSLDTGWSERAARALAIRRISVSGRA
jgi:hypothetical protein